MQVITTPGERGWTRQHVTAGIGMKQDRQLVVYRPSLDATDSVLEFGWNPSSKTVGWVFRARDAANYYAMRLKVLGSGSTATMWAEHFTVSGGTESPHYERLVPFPGDDSKLRVKMDVVGSTFTLYLQGSAEDYWSDSAFSSGGLGFFEERNQPSDVQAVRISFSKMAQSNFASAFQSMTKSLQ
jgi:hypothetical protein